MRIGRIVPLALASLMFVGCAANNSDAVQSMKVERTNPSTVSKSDDVLLQLWDKEMVEKYKDIVYPGFELSYVVGDEGKRIAVKTTDGIYITQTKDAAKGYNISVMFLDEKIEFNTEYSVLEADYSLTGADAPRTMYKDVTGDNVNDIVIRTNSIDQRGTGGYSEGNICECVIVDGADHKVITIALDGYYNDFLDITDVALSVERDKATVITTLENGSESAETIDIQDVDATVVDNALLNDKYQYIYLGDDGVYVGFWVTADYTVTYDNPDLCSFSNECCVLVKNRLEYNKDSGEFILGDGYELSETEAPWNYTEVK